MSITVFEALQLPIMKRANLVAGHGGINTLIKWVTIVEVIEDTTRLQEGEFLITTAYGLAEDKERQNSFIKELAAQQISALAIQTGFYLHTIPPQFIEAANRFQLPLFELPADLNFSMVTKEILQQVVNRQFEQMAYSEDIHRKLIELVLANGGLTAIAQLLASWTSGGVLITDQQHRLMAEACPFLTTEKKQLLIEISQDKHLECISFGDFFIHITPVVANQVRLGQLLIINKQHALEKLDKLAIGQAAIVCALEFLKLAAVEQTEQRLQEDFLEEVIAGKYSSTPALIEKAKAFGFNPTALHLFVKIMLDPLVEPELQQRIIANITSILQQEGATFVLKHRHNALLLLMAADQTYTHPNHPLLAKLEASWYSDPLTANLPLFIGVGNAYTEMTQLAQSAKQADLALKYAPLLLNRKAITYYQDLAPYYIFMEMLEKGIQPADYYRQELHELIHYDRHHQSELLRTLEIYLYENMNMKKAAASLYIHRHTLKYRLEKIEALTGLELGNYHQRLQLHLALICYKLDQLQG